MHAWVRSENDLRREAQLQNSDQQGLRISCAGSFITSHVANRLAVHNLGATTHFDYWGVNMAATLLFTLADGLSCIMARFPHSGFDDIKSSMIALYGQPHETLTGIPQFPELATMRRQFEQISTWPEHIRPSFTEAYFKFISRFDQPIDSVMWQDGRIQIRASNRVKQKPNYAEVCISTIEYMQQRTGWQTLTSVTDLSFVFISHKKREVDNWKEEPGGFDGLILGTPKAVTEEQIPLSNCRVVMHGNVLCEASLKIGELNAFGELVFVADKLAIVCGNFDRSKWIM